MDVTKAMTLSFICLMMSSRSFESKSLLPNNTIDDVYYTDVTSLPCLSIFQTSKNTTGYLIAQSMTFKDASKYCQDQGMVLYEVGSEDELQEIYKNAKKYFKTGGGTVIWINGKWSARAEAWFAHPQHEPFYLTEVFSAPEYRGIYGRCLAIESPDKSGYEIKNFRCVLKNYFYCKI